MAPCRSGPAGVLPIADEGGPEALMHGTPVLWHVSTPQLNDVLVQSVGSGARLTSPSILRGIG
jgi:hypothetical protein